MGVDRPEEQRGRGLTPETAAALRSHILGIQQPDDMDMAEEAEFNLVYLTFSPIEHYNL